MAPFTRSNGIRSNAVKRAIFFDSPRGRGSYETPDCQVRVNVRLEKETVWLTQRQMADLFDTTAENVTMHLKIIFKIEELEESATAKDFLVVQTEGNAKFVAI